MMYREEKIAVFDVIPVACLFQTGIAARCLGTWKCYIRVNE